MFKPFKWNYPVLRGMDIFFSSNLYPNGDLIRSVTGPNGIKDMFNPRMELISWRLIDFSIPGEVLRLIAAEVSFMIIP